MKKAAKRKTGKIPREVQRELTKLRCICDVVRRYFPKLAAQEETKSESRWGA